MPQVHCYLNQKMADQLDDIKQEEHYESSSQTMKEILSLGIDSYFKNKDMASIDGIKHKQQKEEKLNKMHTTYLLRILELNADILRCVYDNNKIINSHDNPEEHISKIKNKVDQYIKEYAS